MVTSSFLSGQCASEHQHLTFVLTLVFAVQLLSLVVQIFFSQMLNIQKPLNNVIHGAVYER